MLPLDGVRRRRGSRRACCEDRQAPAEDKALDVAQQLCLGLAAAHERGRAAPRPQARQRDARRARPRAPDGLRARGARERDRRGRRVAPERPATWRRSSLRGDRGHDQERPLRARARPSRDLRRSPAGARTTSRGRASSRSTSTSTRPSCASSPPASIPIRGGGRRARSRSRRTCRAATRSPPRSARASCRRRRWSPRPCLAIVVRKRNATALAACAVGRDGPGRDLLR